MEIQDLIALGDKLLYIDEPKFRQIVELLEQMGDHPDIRRTIAIIRPRMVELRIHRRPTLKRLFCDPFEDLFETFKADPAPLSVIERALMNGLWPLVETTIGKEGLKVHRGALQDGPQRNELAEAFWAECAGIVAGIAATAAGDAGRRDGPMDLRLTPDRMRALADIATILSIAPEVRDLKAALSPKPVSKLHQDHLEGIQEAGRRVARSHPEALKLFVLLAASRMANPSALLGGLWEMDLGQKPVDRATLFMDLSGTVMAQIEDRSRSLKASPERVPDRMAVADLAVDLIASLDATRDAMEQSRNKSFDQRLKQVRGSVHEMVRTQVLQDAETGIVAALGGLDGGADDRTRLAQAESQARALRKCSTIAEQLGLRGELREMTQKTTATLTEKARQALGRGGVNGGGVGGVGGGARSGYTAIRMIELLAGSAEANKVMDEILNGGRR